MARGALGWCSEAPSAKLGDDMRVNNCYRLLVDAVELSPCHGALTVSRNVRLLCGQEAGGRRAKGEQTPECLGLVVELGMVPRKRQEPPKTSGDWA